jgi:hypothetical protein
LESLSPCAKLYETTPTGRISKKSRTVFLNYCPWCGEQLRETQ